ncbi:hypothetical protein DBR39_13630 [Chryseobacterium sp. KBW03]|uniref:hypothetical protein n=1 Tax=Chryseobacterium sp. KBW03 TaxID=2153362 RepID=UPI000F5915CB|nr:hypothetical protein [Chryseobacterium sp. KBW03]RQO37924.1 hypothetical protein DBR39_13630 [Chryseobacterium sp. KBW03]
MDKTTLKKVLQLDSLINFLDWQERAQIHHCNESAVIASKKVLIALEWIGKVNWESPQTKYGQDRLLYFFNSEYDCWFVDEDYLKLYPQYKNDLLKIKQL